MKPNFPFEWVRDPDTKSKTLGWSGGKVYGSVRRLEKDKWIKTEKPKEMADPCSK